MISTLLAVVMLAVVGIVGRAWADPCTLSGPYVAGVTVDGEPVAARFAFTPPTPCAGYGIVEISAEGREGATLRYRVSGTRLRINLPWFGDAGPQVMSGDLGATANGRAQGFSFEGGDLAGTAIAAE